MGFNDTNSGAAASTFLALYVIYIFPAIYAVYRKGFRTAYTALLFFSLMRIGAQTSAVGFSVVGLDNVRWLIAYLVLGAEGYFALILCAISLLASAELEETGRSFWTPTEVQKAQRGTSRSILRSRSPLNLFRLLLIPANIIIIVGGSMLSGEKPTDPHYDEKLQKSKGLRGAGQGIFLLQTAIVGVAALYMMFSQHIRAYKTCAVLGAMPFLLVRGVYGLLSAFIQSLNYFDMSNYTGDGLTSQFIAREYVLGATMELIIAVILLSTFFFKTTKPQDQIVAEDKAERGFTSETPSRD